MPGPAQQDSVAPVAGALLGLALGDALGFVVEAEPPEVAGAYVHNVLRAGRAGERHHPRFPFGQYSDDTQLARELLLSIAEAGRWDPAGFGGRLAALVFAGRDVGAGPATRSAALRLVLGAPWAHAGTPAPYAGNGSAMRVAPAGVLYRGDEGAWRRCATEQSRVSHHDPRCTAGSLAVAGAAVLGAARDPLDPASFLDRVAEWCAPESPAMAAAVRAVEDWLTRQPSEAARRLHQSGLDPAHTAEWHGISSYVVPSVAWSLYAFLRSPDDWWEAVCTAIEVGGDTDTMAAMAGAFAGARLGPGALPSALLERLTDQGSWGAEALAHLAETCVRTLAPPSGTNRVGVNVAEPTP